MSERETLEADVLIVGAGPAGLASAIRLAQLAKKTGTERSITVLEKGGEAGAHICSGAVIDPEALGELLPGFEADGAPVESRVEEECLYYLTAEDCIIAPFLPKALENHGNLVVSLSQLTRWLAGRAEELGVDLFTGFAAVEPIVEDGRVMGVRTGDRGVDKDGKQKPHYEQGVDVRAKMTIIAEGGRGALTRLLADRFKLNEGRAAQVYATGVKEVWELPSGHFHKGRVIHTMGWPLKQDAYGGGFIYELSRNRIAIGFVVGLDYHDPFLDPHHEFQRFKTHPKIRALLEGGKMVEYGAKTLPEGGWEAVPKTAMPGAMLVGDAAGFLDALRLKGVHHAIKSGMLAAESAFAALDDPSKAPEAYEKNVSDSSIGKELRASRHFKKGFKLGFIPGMIGAAAGEATGGWSPFAAVRLEEGHRHMRTVKRYHGAEGAKPVRLAFDEKTTFQKMTSVYNSGTTHEEDQPCHLRVEKPDLCAERCTREYGNPCQYFCPAGVYEWVEPGKLQINASNCVHCKTCDIMDPYGIIRWVPPEGGGGPGYVNL